MSLIDILQAASNSAASSISAPVDGIAWLLQRAGVPIQKPIGGSDWMAEKGLTRAVQPGAANVTGETLGLLAPLIMAAKAPQVAGQLLARTHKTATSGANPNYTAARSSAKILDPKPAPQRPFDVDYPQGAAGEPGSRLAFDVDGRPLSAEHVFGRRVVGGMDEGGSAGETAAVLAKLGVELNPVAARELSGDAGRFIRSGSQRAVAIDKGLTEAQFGRVLQHETGHVIDDLAFGAIPTKGIDKPLRSLYEELNTPGWFKPGRGVRPESLYRGEQVQRELMAEAIRAYIRDPNFIKTKYPEVAKRIREHVNANQNLRNVVQFNQVAPLALLGSGLAFGTSESDQP